MCVRKRDSLFVWLFDICGLQFGIMREVCCHLVLILWFGDLFSLDLLQFLDLICGSLFGLYAIHIWYLVYVFGICKLLVIWFCIYEKELFGCIWDLGLWVPLHQFVWSQIWYSENCSSLSIDVGYCQIT